MYRRRVNSDAMDAQEPHAGPGCAEVMIAPRLGDSADDLRCDASRSRLRSVESVRRRPRRTRPRPGAGRFLRLKPKCLAAARMLRVADIGIMS
jgi:hypothetical protein